MKKLLKRTLWACCYFLMSGLTVSTGFAQSTIPKFSPVVAESFDPRLANQFPDAPAVVLLDYGEVAFEYSQGSPRVRYNYFQRILILKDPQPGTGRVEITYNAEGGELLQRMRGATYQLNSVGAPVAFKLDRRRVEQTRGEGTERKISFQLPFVKKGSIVEYGYTLYSNEIETLRPWRFQRELPVLRSEYHTLIPEMANYIAIGRGNLEGLEKYREHANFSTFISHNIYIMNGLQAITDRWEPFMPVENDLVPQLTFTRVEGQREFLRADTWDEFNAKMLNGKSVSISRSAEKTLDQKAREISGKYRGREEKAEAIYNYVRSEFKWDGQYEAFLSGSINRVINQKTGSSAEINLILMYMLQSAGIKSSPVLISTRQNGRVETSAPLLAQFDHLIVVAELNEENMLLDAVGKEADFSALPTNDLNGEGFVVRKDKWGWMPIVSSDKLFRQTYSRIDLAATGEISGIISVRNEGYTADQERRRYEAYREPENYFREQVLTGLPGAKISEQYLKNEESSDEPFVTRCEFVTTEKRFLEATGEYLIFRPMLTRSIPENPFREPERAYPLDLPMPTNERYVLAMIIPEGYEAVQLPPPIHVKLPGDSGAFKYQSQVVGPFLQLVSSITLNQTVFMPHEYGAVRAFFDYIVEKHNEAIVFRKKAHGETRTGIQN